MESESDGRIMYVRSDEHNPIVKMAVHFVYADGKEETIEANDEMAEIEYSMENGGYRGAKVGVYLAARGPGDWYTITVKHAPIPAVWVVYGPLGTWVQAFREEKTAREWCDRNVNDGRVVKMTPEGK